MLRELTWPTVLFGSVFWLMRGGVAGSSTVLSWTVEIPRTTTSEYAQEENRLGRLPIKMTLSSFGSVFERDGAEVVVDEVSLDLLRGSTVDFEEEIVREGFAVINNPNSDSSCGCGVSFGLKE